MSVSGTSGIYYLPKALLHIKLERTETFSICERKRSKDGKEVAIDPMRQIKQLTTVDFSLSYVSKSVVPDPEYAYAIRYDESAWSSDKLTVHVRSKESRVGKECVSTCRSRWSPYH